MQASSLHQLHLTHHSLPASFLHSITHLTPVIPFTYPHTTTSLLPPSLISILSFSSIRPNHLSPFEVMESSKPQSLLSASHSASALSLFCDSLNISPFCSFTAILNMLALSCNTVHQPTTRSVPSCASSSHWCSPLLMLLCETTLTVTKQ